MAEIRCPMCGRLNPAELDNCIYCQARLTPVTHSSLPPAEPKPPAAPLSDSNDDEAPDWLQSLRSKGDDAEAGSATPFGGEGGLSGENDDETPDWLGRIRDSASSEPSVKPFEDSAEPAVDDSDETPDWLKPIRQRAVDEGLKNEPPLGVPNLGASSKEEPAPEADWLSSFREEAPETLQPSEPYQVEVPDWMAKISDLKASEPEEEPFPDWLQDVAIPIPSEAEAELRPEEPAEQPAQVDEKTAPEETAPSGRTPDDELREWMQNFRVDASPSASPFVNETADEPPAKAPSVVFSDAQTPPGPVPQQPPPTPPEEEVPAEPPAEPQGPQWEADWAPDWLAKLEAKAIPGEPASYGTNSPLILGNHNENEEEVSQAPGSAQADMPDWLRGVASPDSSPAASTGGEEPTDEGSQEWIAPAELPSWVQAMRPVETAAPTPPLEEENDQQMIESGPLAGLRGILPSEPTATEFHRSARFSPHLEVTERQQSNSEMLQKLLASESEAEPIPSKALISTQRILRLVLTVVLFAVLLYPILAHTQIVPMPDTIPSEVLWANETVDSLSQNDPVLLIVDYSPSLAGEMEAASAGVVDHLMARGARLTLISSTPTGPALATRLFGAVYSHQESYMGPYADGERIANLGYLPGGTTGLASFASQPKDTAYFDITGEPAWTLPALQGVSSLEGFAQVVLLTDNVDTARAWLEQVRPQMGASDPFVLVTSTQAAPVMRAYLDSGQVQGMVSGLAGGADYELLRLRPGVGRSYWDAYQAGIWLAVIAILGGALFNTLWPLWRDRDHQGEAVA